MRKITVTGLIMAVVIIALLMVAGFNPEAAYALPLIPVFGMAALTGDRNTARRDGEILSMGVAAAKKIYAGALVARDANGYATPGAVATTLRGAGRAEAQADNSSGADGDIPVEVRKGVFKFANSAAADEITAADIGNDCYIVDDQTVAKTDGTGTRSVAGKVFDVESDGVWVKFE